MAGDPVAFIEWENYNGIPPNRYYQIAETGDGGYVPTVYVDSARLYAVGSDDHYNEYLGFINAHRQDHHRQPYSSIRNGWK